MKGIMKGNEGILVYQYLAKKSVLLTAPLWSVELTEGCHKGLKCCADPGLCDTG